MKSILMTGASGLVGSRFVEMFGDEYEVGNLDLTTGVDILNEQSVRDYITAHKASALVHLAAFTDTQAAFAQTGDKSGSCYRVNVEGTRIIAKVCQDFGIHLIHISTDFVFDGSKKELYVESDERHPLEWYGQTKAMAEEEVEKSGATYSIVRIAYPYRAHFAGKPDIITKIKNGLQASSLPPQFTDTTLTPTFVDDIMYVLKAIAENNKTGIYHAVGSSVLSPYDLAVAVAERFGFDKSLVQKGSLTNYLEHSPRPFSRYSGISNAKATRELGVKFATIQEGLQALA